MPSLQVIREQRTAKVLEARQLLNAAESAKRELSGEEQTKFNELRSEITKLEEAEARQQFLDDAERRQAGTVVEGGGDRGIEQLETRVSLLRVLQAGVEGKPLTGAEAEYNAEITRRNGRAPQGIYMPMRAIEKRVTTAGNAGELIGTDHRGDQYIEPLRNALLARRLGVRVLSGLRGNLSIPKYGTGLSVGWVAENQAVPESNLDMDSVTLSPKHAGGVTELSRQLIQQSSPDVEQLVRDDFAYMLAKAIDSALIKGGGANEPKGVMSTAGIQTANPDISP